MSAGVAHTVPKQYVEDGKLTIRVPMPYAADVFASLENLAIVAQLSEVMHQVDTAKAGSHNQRVRLKIVSIRIGAAIDVLVMGAAGGVSANVASERHDGDLI